MKPNLSRISPNSALQMSLKKNFSLKSLLTHPNNRRNTYFKTSKNKCGRGRVLIPQQQNNKNQKTLLTLNINDLNSPNLKKTHING